LRPLYRRPGEPDFPADPITVLRYGWPYLLVYYIVAAIIVFLPGPAVVGLLCLLLGWALTVVAQPAALLDAHFYGRMVGIIGGFYILPLLLVFYIAYGALFLHARFCGATTQNA